MLLGGYDFIFLMCPFFYDFIEKLTEKPLKILSIPVFSLLGNIFLNVDKENDRNGVDFHIYIFSIS